ncbi:MotA/TolQ/ExbB proton channel family protein [bacterium]|nr:MotA/TolQ/ExbB proton channel family protein [bacterium]
MSLKQKYLLRGLLMMVALSGMLTGQDLYQPHITVLNRDIERNWINVPQSFECRIEWDVMKQEDGRWIPSEKKPFHDFVIECYQEENLLSKKQTASSEPQLCVFKDLRAGSRYRFVVSGIQEGDTVRSEVAEVVTGDITAAGTREIQWYHRFPILSGRTPLQLVGREKFYDKATEAGKIAFWVIWWFFLSAVLISTQCWRYLRIGHVLPMDRMWAVGHGYDAIYERNKSKKFQRILDEWKQIIALVHKRVRDHLTGRETLGSHEIEGAGAKFWQEYGADALNDLIKRIEEYDDYPTAKIFKSGMQNHEMNGFHWMKVSEEVERAVENRASSEIEKLRRKSFMDWLWNLGTFAPMVGLFGTATGISSAFGKLERLSTDTEQMQMVQELAGGIYEALWTTIEGLAVGILLMLIYHYYQNKLSWIYSKWEEIYVDITGKL